MRTNETRRGAGILAPPAMAAMAVAAISGAAVAADDPAEYARRTAVVYNEAQPGSRELAIFYAEKRGIDPGRLIGLRCPTVEEIPRGEFERTIRTPLREALGGGTRILAVMRGVPLKIAEFRPGEAVGEEADDQPKPVPAGRQNQASVDSELALILQDGVDIAGSIPNPYFRQERSFLDGAFSDQLIVGRLDGPDDETVRRMITDAVEVEAAGLWGKMYVDLADKTDGGYAQGENWLRNVARIGSQAGFPVIVDPYPETFPLSYPMRDAALYFGWYAWHFSGPFRNPAMRFKKGAVAVHIHSFSANTVRDTRWNWVAPFLQLGACATVGNVYEPYLGLTHHLDVMLVRLMQGHCFAEAAWGATPALSWMSTAVGDPLYRPFAREAELTDLETDGDYKAMRVAVKRWGLGDGKTELMTNLERGATNLKSGNLWEVLGLMALGSADLQAAQRCFAQAIEAFPDRADQLRVHLHVVDVLRQSGKTEEAVEQLRRLEKDYSAIVEVGAVKAILKTLAPPAEKTDDGKQQQ